MEVKVASEHITDCSDCITEGVRSLKRVAKAFPNLQPELGEIQIKLETVRTSLGEFHKTNFSTTK